MKNGDTVRVRLAGAAWVDCRVELISSNGKALAVSAAEGLPLVAIDQRTLRQVLLLSRVGDHWEEVVTGNYYEVNDATI